MCRMMNGGRRLTVNCGEKKRNFRICLIGWWTEGFLRVDLSSREALV